MDCLGSSYHNEEMMLGASKDTIESLVFETKVLGACLSTCTEDSKDQDGEGRDQ